MRLLLLLVCLLTLPTRADTRSEAVAASQAFDRAVLKASSVKDLYPLVTDASVHMLRGLTGRDQAKWMSLLQTMTRMEAAAGYFPLVDAKVTGNRATLTFQSTKQEKGSKQTLAKEVKLRLEQGAWKVDVSEYKL